MLDYGNHRTLELTKRAVTGTAFAALIFSAFAIAAIGQNIERSSKQGVGHEEKEILKKVRDYPGTPITVENREGCPIFIKRADVKTITSDDYYQLTGTKTDANGYVAFPKVRLINRTDKHVAGFALFLTNRRTERINFFKVSKTTVEPNGDYSVLPDEWVTPEKLTEVTADGKTVSIKKRPSLDSPKVWLEGNAGDFVLEPVEVEFADGSKWTRTSSSLAPSSNPRYIGKWYPGAIPATTANAPKIGIIPQQRMLALRARVFECVCLWSGLFRWNDYLYGKLWFVFWQ